MNDYIDRRVVTPTDLIKEEKSIIKTITKFDTVRHSLNEFAGFQFAKSIGCSIPTFVSLNDGALTMEFVEGISVYRTMEVLAKHGYVDVIEKIVKYLCDDVHNIQEQRKFLTIDKLEYYDVRKKVGEIFTVMQDDNWKNVELLLRRSFKILKIFEEYACVPFRDATPKNYIVRGMCERSILQGDADTIIKNIVSIDFSTINTLTTRIDDFASVLYHYMIPDDIRSKMMKSFTKDMPKEDVVIGTFVRLGRFWVRRRYYQKEYPELFDKRYAYENMKFYEESFRKSVDDVIQLIS